MKRLLLIGAVAITCNFAFIISQTRKMSSTFQYLNASYDDAPQNPPKMQNEESFTFAGCLLIKDQNMLLPEWLAYHYTVLPLRRLIVAVDPLSYTDPATVLDQWSSLINITIWHDEKIYWKNSYGLISNKTLHQGDKHLTAVRTIFVERQKHFLGHCLEVLRDEGQSWTILVDIDEYLAFNHFDELEGSPQWCKEEEVQCKEIYMEARRNGTHIRSHLGASTAAEIMHSHESILRNQNIGIWNLIHYDTPFVIEKPCIMLARYLVISRESELGEIQEQIGKEFNVSSFQTLRYRYRARVDAPQIGKTIINAKYYDGRMANGPHRVLGEMCTGNTGYGYNAMNSFRVHHYVGRWESFRQPGADFRGYDTFQKRSNERNVVYDNTTGFSKDTNTSWLARFMSIVGREKAISLTHEAILRSEREKLMLEIDLALQ